ncbi:helix-hairpin-helix domain-containing protein [Salmonella enterica subsp. enterica serovar Dublin]|uniref:helix-hairpin-helix domain-containing protein n=1 Tax=Salmonella enterica TaxID=28901 RepID=UPI0023809D75|nr:helix-hairpin-helix domain-containing protein [Salmonella enterica]WDX21685.1 helix-hairpin-helix domain-containing protein [Salmonella enterica subsp. enterica serovar Dublin]
MNTASVPLLTRVAGLTRMMAQNIVAWRDENGQFQNRQQLLKVSRLGRKRLSSAGFLRINHGDNPLDVSPSTRKPIRLSNAFWRRRSKR